MVQFRTNCYQLQAQQCNSSLKCTYDFKTQNWHLNIFGHATYPKY